MGKRSRKRSTAGTAPTPRPPRQAPATRVPGTPVDRRAKLSEAPPPLWAPVPVTEILVLVGMILAGVGFFGGGAVPLLIGLALVSVATLELVIREHFAGYRSHSTLLAGTAAVLVVAVLSVVGLPPVVALLAGVLVFAVSFQAARSAFARRAGGLGFRV